MNSLRVQKVKSDLERAISAAIFEIDKFAFIGEILLSADLRNVKIGVYSILNNKTQEELVNELNEKLYLIKRSIANKISLKYFPNIVFIVDRHKERIMRIQTILESEE